MLYVLTWISTKLCMTYVKDCMPICTHMHENLRTFIFVIICEFVNTNIVVCKEWMLYEVCSSYNYKGLLVTD
jgi:hypothetical protein